MCCYFETDIHADHVISVLEKYYQAKIVPENTLIIFDEIQMCERALTSLKYFSEDPGRTPASPICEWA